MELDHPSPQVSESLLLSALTAAPYSVGNIMRRENIRPTISPALLSVIEQVTSAEHELNNLSSNATVKQELPSTDRQLQATPPYFLDAAGNNSAFDLFDNKDQQLFNNANALQDAATGQKGNSGVSTVSPTPGRGCFVCDECGKVFQNNSALVKHRLIHSDERSFICPVCSKAFKRHDHLSGHLNVHKSVKPFACVIGTCDKSYCDARSLRRHLEHGHNVRNATVHSLKGTMYIKCGEGDEISVPMSNQSLSPLLSADKRDRERNSSGDTGSSRSTQDISPTGTGFSHSSGSSTSDRERVECGQCGRSFKNVPALNGHMRLHSATHRIQTNVNNSLSDNDTAGQCHTTITGPVSQALASNVSMYRTINYCNQLQAMFPDVNTQPTLPYTYGNAAAAFSHDAMTHLAQDTAATQTDYVSSLAGPGTQPSLLEPLSLLNTSQEVLSAPATMLSSAANPSQPPSPSLQRDNTHQLPLADASDPLAGLDLVGDLGAEVDDESIEKELESLALSRDLVDIGAQSFESDFMTTNYNPPAMPERRRHLTAPCRLTGHNKPINSNSSSSSLSALRQRRRSRGKPENVCQLLQGGLSKTRSGSTLSSGCGSNSSKLNRRHSTGRPRSRPLFHLNDAPAAKRKPPPLALNKPPPLNRYPSQLRSPRFWEGPSLQSNKSPVPYTPPPILSPMRHGSGLFCNVRRHLSGQLSSSVATGSDLVASLLGSGSGGPKSAPLIGPAGGFWQSKATTEQDRVELNRRRPSILGGTSFDDNQAILDDLVDSTPGTPLEAPASDTRPHINEGSQFQADVPEWTGRPQEEAEEADVCKETIVFEPSCLANVNEESLDLFVRLSCSSAVYGGARNKELALHLLHQHEGNIEDAILSLLSSDESTPVNGVKMEEQSYWSPEQVKLFERALQKHEKDFYLIQKELTARGGDKTVSQCVSFYYTWKKTCPDQYRKYRMLRRKRNLLPLDTDVFLPPSYNLRSTNDQAPRKESAVRFADEPTPAKEAKKEVVQPIRTRKGAQPSEDGLFHCQVCPKAFPKVKSLNAHMKTHSSKREH